jgi:hypothetical protein
MVGSQVGLDEYMDQGLYTDFLMKEKKIRLIYLYIAKKIGGACNSRNPQAYGARFCKCKELQPI